MSRRSEPFRDDGHTIVDMSDLPQRSLFGLQRLKKKDSYTDAQGNPRRKRTFSGLELALFALITLLVLLGLSLLVIHLIG